MTSILNIQEVSKSYRERWAVQDLNMEVKKGEILCLLGPNGSGKTTLIHMISGLVQADQGVMYYQGETMKKARQKFQKVLGFVPQNLALYEDLSAYENLNFFGGLYGLRKEQKSKAIKEALELAGLSDRANDKVLTFSAGMKRRLNIACGIIHHPDLVIMDEPTVGIDPQSRNHILQSIKKLHEEGMTILYTTHYMEEVEEIATRIIIMDHGEIIAQGTKETLKEAYEKQRQYILDIGQHTDYQEDAFYSIEGIQKVELKDHQLSITTMKQVDNLDLIIQLAIQQKLIVQNLMMRNTTLETVFLHLTGRSLRD